MNTIVLFFIIGLMLLGVEVFVPGGILGVFGGLALLAGVVLAFVEYGQTGGWTAFGVASVLSGGMFYFEFRILPRTRMGRKLFLHSEVAGTSQPPVAEAAGVLDKTGEALTPLSPSGYVMIDGRRYEAFSRSGFVDKGATVRVVGIDNFRLIVSNS
jgi:membrane-bound ClpP family serine protease